jgi:hypothetical protein
MLMNSRWKSNAQESDKVLLGEAQAALEGQLIGLK